MPAKVRVRYQSIEFGQQDIHLRTLRDRQEFSDPEQRAENYGVSPSSWPLFGVVWESGEILARLMVSRDIQGQRILEVGCGLALASLVLGSRDADVTATDHNPDAGEFLAHNVALNELKPIQFLREGWGDSDSTLGLFDLVIGSDLLYEKSNVERLSNYINTHTKPVAEVVIVDPGRGLAGQFTRRMVELGFESEAARRVDADISTSYKGKVLRFGRG